MMTELEQLDFIDTWAMKHLSVENGDRYRRVFFWYSTGLDTRNYAETKALDRFIEIMTGFVKLSK